MKRSFALRQRLDPLGIVLCALGVGASLWLPMVTLKPNRILPGMPQPLLEQLPPLATLIVLALMVAVAVTALWVRAALWRLLAATCGLIALAMAVAAAGDALTPPGNIIVRVAPGSGFWLLAVALALLAVDAMTRWQPRPLARVALWLGSILLLAYGLSSGSFDQLSVMREYAANAERFQQELLRHVWLAGGSLLAALAVGLPLGLLCYRMPRWRAATLSALSFVQTIPSIALFGILMAPLAALAAAVPWAAALGVRGIGTAPAIVALFLYSLLPVVANTVVGLVGVSPTVREAARGMGLTERQLLTQIELPLALPVLLTGVRIVLVQNIGLVTVAALIGAGGLGAFVFQGIGQMAVDLVLLGALPIVALALSAAILLDALAAAIRRTT